MTINFQLVANAIHIALSLPSIGYTRGFQPLPLSKRARFHSLKASVVVGPPGRDDSSPVEKHWSIRLVEVPTAITMSTPLTLVRCGMVWSSFMLVGALVRTVIADGIICHKHVQLTPWWRSTPSSWSRPTWHTDLVHSLCAVLRVLRPSSRYLVVFCVFCMHCSSK